MPGPKQRQEQLNELLDKMSESDIGTTLSNMSEDEEYLGRPQPIKVTGRFDGQKVGRQHRRFPSPVHAGIGATLSLALSAKRMTERMMESYPITISSRNVGGMPNSMCASFDKDGHRWDCVMAPGIIDDPIEPLTKGMWADFFDVPEVFLSPMDTDNFSYPHPPQFRRILPKFDSTIIEATGKSLSRLSYMMGISKPLFPTKSSIPQELRIEPQFSTREHNHLEPSTNDRHKRFNQLQKEQDNYWAQKELKKLEKENKKKGITPIPTKSSPKPETTAIRIARLLDRKSLTAEFTYRNRKWKI